VNIGIDAPDSKLPNLAIMKISAWHKSFGDTVEWFMPLGSYDKVYASILFEDTEYNYYPDGAEIGGTGHDKKKKLPYQIDDMEPDYSIYPEFKDSVGFVTRGCIRNCHFCFVPEKEGKIHKYRDIEQVYRGGNLTLMDNNILAMPDEFKKIVVYCQTNKVKVDFNQGMDCRLLTREMADVILENKNIFKPEIRFAFDNLNYRKYVESTVKMLNGHRCFWYVFCDDNIEDALERCLILKRLGQRAYLMRHHSVKGNSKFNVFAHWVNCMGAMKTFDVWEHAEYYKNRNKYKKQESID
jgi:hypothetical protein